MLFRPVRHLLSEAMAEVREVNDHTDIEKIVNDGAEPDFQMKVVRYKYQGFDSRIGWESHLIIGLYSDGKEYPCGYTNAPLDSIRSVEEAKQPGPQSLDS